ncbi:MAG: RraA family protein [Acetobacteraceae bacterium]|nr:RraA family protein [Acetobacteraceae bacterium]
MTDLAMIREKLFAALLSDVMDALGTWNQALPPRVRPLDESLVMVGRARTALFADQYHVAEGDNPYELEIKLIDSLLPGEIPVFACGASGRIAPWGELLSTASKARGAAGALMDGLTRDIRAIRAMGFPVFAGGIGPLDSKGRGKIVALDVPVEVAGVKVSSGDLVFGDADGVVVVPKAIEKKVIEAAFEKLKGEHSTLADLQAGMKLGDVFAKYGVL